MRDESGKKISVYKIITVSAMDGIGIGVMPVAGVAVAPTAKPARSAELTPEQRRQYAAFVRRRLLRQQQDNDVSRLGCDYL